MPRSSRLLPLLWLLATACGPGDAPDGPEPVGGDGGRGLVLLTEDPALRDRTPEELAAEGIRPYFHDFGNVRLGEVVRHAFRFENTDPAPVVVTRMQPSCSCTTAELVLPGPDGEPVRARATSRGGPLPPIPPGATAEFVMTLDTRHSEPTSHNVDKLYTIQIATDSENTGYLRLEAHIFIERAFQASPQPLDLGRVPRNGGGTGTIDVIQVGDTGARVVGVGPLPPGVNARVVEEPVYGRPMWKVEVALEPPLEPGPHLHRFELMTEDADELPFYPVPVEVHAYAVDDVDWSPQRILLRNASVADGPLEASVEVYSLLEGERLRVTGVRLEGEGTDRLAVRHEPNLLDANQRSERWTVTVATMVPFGDDIVRGKVLVELEGRDPVAIDVLAHPR